MTMKTDPRQIIRSKLAPAGAVLAALACFFLFPASAAATIAPSPCAGNICVGELTVGSDKVRYAFTQHVNPDGEFKIRLNGGTYSTVSLISFIIFDLPPFVSWDKYAGPGAIYLVGEDVNPGRTAYERRAPTGCAGCRVDQVMSVKYSGLSERCYPFNLFVLQNGGSASKNGLEFCVDSAAPLNNSEADPLKPLLKPLRDMAEALGYNYSTYSTLSCADKVNGVSIDNDLDYRANCADSDCDGEQGDLINSELRCQIIETRCDDEFDNDADGAADCADITCDKLVGRTDPVPLAYCQYGNEYGDALSLNGTSPCSDYFDNDADGRQDCYDNLYTDPTTGDKTAFGDPAAALTQPLVCWRHAGYGCPPTEISCTDALDNDIDIPYSENAYPEAGVTADPPTVPPAVGLDCRDYDCAGNSACPDQENHLADRTVDECQCFDGVDNDLDHQIDCKDPDCVGAYCPSTGQVCLDKEFDLGQRIQMCANGFDDDGDDLPHQPGSSTDCRDSDCRQKFGDCGPCPDREDIAYESCSDGKDNDANDLADCRDPRCAGAVDGVPKLGNIVNAAYCAGAAGERDGGGYPNLCADGFDNDSDGKTDCADPGCDLFETSPGGPHCETPKELSCDDGFDNDGNGLIDCLDQACFDKPACHGADWDKNAACVEVPRWSNRQSFTANDPTVYAQSYVTVHVNASGSRDIVDRVRIEGRDVYTSVTVVIGDNTDINKVYPYASETYCRLVNSASGGSGKDDLGLTVVENGSTAGGAIMLYNLKGKMPASFDVTVECPTPEEPAAVRYYPVSISMLRLGNLPEYGEIPSQTRLYEAMPPKVTAIEAEGEIGGVITVPYGQSRRFRVIPDDPVKAGDSVPPVYSSGICQCGLELVGEAAAVNSTNGGCVIPSAYKFIRDLGDGDDPDSLTLRASALDGAANLSLASDPDSERTLKVNVTPALGDALFIEHPTTPPASNPRPFFNKKDTANKISVSSRDTSLVTGQFITALNDSFAGPCKLYVRNSSGAPLGPGSLDVPNLYDGIPGLTNVANCLISGADLPSGLTGSGDTDGIYFASLIAMDGDGDTIESNRRPLFMCDSVPGSDADHNDGDVCHWADFDSDGAAEGYYTKLYSNDAKACDNCVNLENPDQADKDANGIGDVCQSLLGRCEVDTDVVCGYHSPTWDGDNACSGDPVSPKCCPDSADPECCPEPTVKTDKDGVSLQDNQACREPWGACSTGGEICFTPENCPKRGLCVTGTCVEGDCSCNSNNDCLDEENNPIADSCVGADLCLSLMYPWIQAPQGNVYSGRYIRTPEPPPPGRANATFCIAAKGGINWSCDVPVDLSDPVNKPQGCALEHRKYVFTSEQCGNPRTAAGSRFERPKSRNMYSTVLGRLDLSGLLAGKYGPVVAIDDPSTFAEQYLNSPLGGRVFVVRGDLNIGAIPDKPPDPDTGMTTDVIPDGANSPGAGTVLVIGGNLYLWDNVAYSENLPDGLTVLDRLASLGWIVLDETDPNAPGYGTKGNVFIGSSVSELVGAFFAGGQGGIFTVAPPETDSKTKLRIRGLMVGRQFHFSRSFKSVDVGSEQIFYDGRAVVNPPPGFGDVTKTMPSFGDVTAGP